MPQTHSMPQWGLCLGMHQGLFVCLWVGSHPCPGQGVGLPHLEESAATRCWIPSALCSTCLMCFRAGYLPLVLCSVPIYLVVSASSICCSQR